jgi:hypothetical protein
MLETVEAKPISATEEVIELSNDNTVDNASDSFDDDIIDF